MDIKDIAIGLLNKSLKLEEIDPEQIDAVIKALGASKELLTKMGSGRPTVSATPAPSSTPASSTPPPSSSSGSSIAEQINFGGHFGPVNKKERLKIGRRGQWDIEEIEKSAVGEKKKTQKEYKRTGKKAVAGKDFSQKAIKLGQIKDVHEAKVKRAKQTKQERRQPKENVSPIKERRQSSKEKTKTMSYKLAKSGYKGYTEKDNIKRKASNVIDERENKVQASPRVKQWKAGTKKQEQQKKIDKFNRKSKVKTFTPEELAIENAKLKVKKD